MVKYSHYPVMKTIYLSLFSILIFACSSNDEVAEVDDFAGDSGTFVDSRDNYVYKWVRIGDQIWMAENLAYLPAVYPASSNSNSELRYYIYEYNGSDAAAGKQNDSFANFGVLYNWPAAKSSSPQGWHLASDEEWKQLEMELGMTEDQVNATGWRGDEQGIMLKATSTWNKNGNGTDSIGFTALAGGLRGSSEGFLKLEIGGYWWSSSENSLGEAWNRGLYWSIPNVNRYSFNKEYGFSVRCVKD